VKKRFHFQVRPSPSNAKGQRVFYLGLRVGYWPCTESPFIQLALAFWRIELWHGLPSYK
jgi:hypothetical protein